MVWRLVHRLRTRSYPFLSGMFHERFEYGCSVFEEAISYLILFS